MALDVIILAAGQGTRMKSSTPKVLHKIGGVAMLERVVQTAQLLNASQIHVVYGYQAEMLRTTLAGLPVNWVYQDQQLGTAHAVEQALPFCAPTNQVLVLYADVPLIAADTLSKLLAQTQENEIGLLTAIFSDPTGLGRIIRNQDHKVVAIVEHKDATQEQLAICEINTGILCAYVETLRHYLQKIDNNNSQKEFYLTDVIKMAVSDHKIIKDYVVDEVEQVQGVNDRWQLAQLERHFQLKQAQALALQGVTLMDPHRLDIRGQLNTGQDVVIDVNVIIEGEVRIGSRSKIGANVILKNAVIGDDVEILSHCVLEDVVIANGCSVGPFARLRPGTKLAEQAKVGNFVEIKNAEIGEHSKINHLSYVGDAHVGQKVNIGAGTITCNYDGAHKHKTIIEDNVFVGSNSALVAPITLEEGATIGAGSVITKTAPKDQLTLTRNKQTSFAGWQRPTKNKTE